MKNNPKVLGLDVSTTTIGWALFDLNTRELLELTHIKPRAPKDMDDAFHALLMKVESFAEKIKDYKKLGITKVVIEEPLLNSNNVYTVATLLRFNSMIAKIIYDELGIVPEFISTYNSRKFAFPELVKQNDKGKYVLFGGMPMDIDKKHVVWELMAKKEPQIIWLYTKNNTLKKECYDMSDAYTCVLGRMRELKIWD